MTRLSLLAAALVAASLALGAPARAADSDQQQVVDHAKVAIDDMYNDSSFGNAKSLIQRAKGVMIVPELVKGGFFVGGEGGSGVLLVKSGGSWSAPAFYTVGAASFGLQIGVETAEVVFFVMSDKALKAWMKNEVKLGAKAGLTVLVLGSNAEAAATTNANVDVIAWAKSKGAYAGITLEGSLIKPRDSYNQAYYGKKLTPSQIVLKSEVSNPAADPLRASLAGK
jgi:lipid-binding SYLF domain-containing protein